MVKGLPTMQETQVQSLGQEDPLEKEMANHSSILAWKIPWMEEPGRLQSLGSQRVGHDTVTSFSLSSLTPGSFFSALFATSQGQGMLAPDRELLSGLLSSAQSLRRVRLCDPMNRSMPGLPVHHQLPESTQTHVHRVSDAIQPSHPRSSLSPPAPNPSQHQSLFQ